jgi:hypothetical protein
MEVILRHSTPKAGTPQRIKQNGRNDNGGFSTISQSASRGLQKISYLKFKNDVTQPKRFKRPDKSVIAKGGGREARVRQGAASLRPTDKTQRVSPRTGMGVSVARVGLPEAACGRGH